jgi:hypothetical protein
LVLKFFYSIVKKQLLESVGFIFFIFREEPSEIRIGCKTQFTIALVQSEAIIFKNNNTTCNFFAIKSLEHLPVLQTRN